MSPTDRSSRLVTLDGRGRDGDCTPPPAQILTGGINGSDSCLES